MNELERAYRDAPQLKSPQVLDERLMHAAKTAPHVVGSHSVSGVEKSARSRLATPVFALASFCVVAIGAGLLFRALWSEQLQMTAPQSESSLAADAVAGADVQQADYELNLQKSSKTAAVEARSASASGNFAATSAAESEMATPSAGSDSMPSDLNSALQDSAQGNDTAFSDSVTFDSDALSATAESLEATSVTSAAIDRLEAQRSRISSPVIPGTESLEEQSADIDRPEEFARQSTASDAKSRVTVSPAQTDDEATPTREWILSRDGDAHTVLVALTETEAELDVVASHFSLPIRKLELQKGVRRWMLFYGEFNKLDEAQLMTTTIKDRLEQSLPDVAPIVVKFDELQQMLQ